eukprot:s1589_g2.t1
MLVVYSFFFNLLVSQLCGVYSALAADIQGYAMLARGEVILDTLKAIPMKRWQAFLTSLGLDQKVDFEEGDIGLAGGVKTWEPALAHPITQERQSHLEASSELSDTLRPVLADSTSEQVRDTFIENVRRVDPSIPESKIQALLHVLGASHLLEDIGFDKVEPLFLPKTTQRALVIPLSHIPRFAEKPPFLDKANYSCAMIHGTNIIGGKYSLAEALARRWHLVDLLDRASTKGKGQQEILLALQYKGAKEHLALKAGGNDMVQLQCAFNGVVTTAEKYTVARSEHCTIRCLIVVWADLSFIRNRQGQSASYRPADSKDDSKDTKDENPDDHPPNFEHLRSWHRRGGYDDEDDN